MRLMNIHPAPLDGTTCANPECPAEAADAVANIRVRVARHRPPADQRMDVCEACLTAHRDREQTLAAAIVRAARLGLTNRRVYEQTEDDAIAAAGGIGVWYPIYLDARAEARATHRVTEAYTQYVENRQVIAELSGPAFDEIDNAIYDAVKDAHDHVLMRIEWNATAEDVTRAEDEAAERDARYAAELYTYA